MEEIWKDIENYIGYYQISNLGRVKSLSRKGRVGDRILKGSLKEGYINISLGRNKEYHTFKVHRLVLSAFTDNVENKRTVNHIDGIRDNNILSNLEWATDKENVNHAFRLGLSSNKGVKNSQTKITEAEVLEIRALKGILSQREIGIKYNLSKGHVCNILRGYNWSHI